VSAAVSSGTNNVVEIDLIDSDKDAEHDEAGLDEEDYRRYNVDENDDTGDMDEAELDAMLSEAYNLDKEGEQDEKEDDAEVPGEYQFAVEDMFYMYCINGVNYEAVYDISIADDVERAATGSIRTIIGVSDAAAAATDLDIDNLIESTLLNRH
jgi:hypothetical protein